MTTKKPPSDPQSTPKNPASRPPIREDSREGSESGGAFETCSYPAFVTGITHPRGIPEPDGRGGVEIGRLLRPVVTLWIDCGSQAEGPRLEELRLPMSSEACAVLAEAGLLSGEALELVIRRAR